jgi:hypothetical protein
MQYVIHCDEDSGRWHVCYRLPASPVLSSVADCPNLHSAQDTKTALERASRITHHEYGQQRKLLNRRFNDRDDD